MLLALRSIAASGTVKIYNYNVRNSKPGALAHRIAGGIEILLNLPATTVVVVRSILSF